MDEPKSYLGGRFTKQNGVVRNNAFNGAYDYSRGKKEKGSRWQRNVNWEDPANGIKFYDLGTRRFSPFSYVVVGLAALGAGFGAVGLITAQHGPIGLAIFILVLWCGVGVFGVRLGVNLNTYDKLHGYRYGSKRVIARYQADLARGRTPQQALVALGWHQTIVTLAGTAAFFAFGAAYWFVRYGG